MTIHSNPSHHKISIAETDAAITLPPSIAAKTGFAEGDWVEIVRVENGVRLQPADSEFVEQMAVAERVLNENEELMRRLADS